MKPLDPLTLPLTGLALIEASAGTGKTYTIATLYLRLLLEAGLAVDRILVVTFTKAATEELRGRIRKRLRQALDWLEGEGGGGEDPLLEALLARVEDPEGARRLLADNLTRLDEAAVYTIHGFCQRMLQDHAFESGAPFEVEFITSEADLRRRVAEDFWRLRAAGLDADGAAWLRSQWRGPGELLAALERTLAQEDLTVEPDLPADAGEGDLSAAREAFDEMRRLWAAEREAIVALLQTHPGLDRRSYSKRVVAAAAVDMDALLAVERIPARLPERLERFTPNLLAAKSRGGQGPEHRFFDRCAVLRDAWERGGRLRQAAFLGQARAALREGLTQLKDERRVLYFDDLLSRLDRALGAPGGDALAERIRAAFPVALIDEFQDTDPLQYRIFQRVYGERADHALLLIGDPKQAIYAFRGADVFTYMRAKDDAAGHQHTLGTNWRSASRLVTAVNSLFERARAPFVYEPAIAFQPVAPGPKADAQPFTLDGETPVPFECWVLPVTDDNRARNGTLRAEDAREAAARACAGRIAELLDLSAAGRARIGDDPLRARDMAVLVRSHREGDRMQQALREVGVASVTLSQDSVFQTAEAEALATVLAAVAEPGDERGLRAALATHLLGRTASELTALADDERDWERTVARFQDYRAAWSARGFMVAFQALLHGEGVAGRLLARADGERCLTNLLQLAELLEVAAREHPGLDGLLRHLAEQRAGTATDEERLLRLESDEALVQVVTVHKSKGLEYPLVFLPFPWSSGPEPDDGPLLYHDPEDRTARLDLGSDARDAHLELARTEALAERLRLFYVAVTRARHQVVLCWGPVNQAEGSAPAYLLHGDPDSPVPASRMQDLSEADIRADLEALAQAVPECIAVRDLPELREGRRARDGSREHLAARDFHGAIERTWRVASYTGLATGAESERPDFDAVAAGEPPVDTLAEEPPAVPDPVFRMPGGVTVGQCLHSLLEDLDFPAAGGPALAEAAERRRRAYGLEGEWQPVMEHLVTDVLDTPLDPGGRLRLRDLTWADRRNEMEFHYPLAPLSPGSLRGALAPFDHYAEAGRGLTFDPVRGLMRGFIDLVFRWQGRYYLVDYKTNHLGERLDDYAAPGLAHAMAHHRYDLQYLVYTVALHRYLARRVPGYSYEQHFGGAYYLFLRGMRPTHGPAYGVFHDRPPLGVVSALDRLFAGEGESRDWW
jgi:exodeoxyribonuclease V beta subunit